MVTTNDLIHNKKQKIQEAIRHPVSLTVNLHIYHVNPVNCLLRLKETAIKPTIRQYTDQNQIHHWKWAHVKAL